MWLECLSADLDPLLPLTYQTIESKLTTGESRRDWIAHFFYSRVKCLLRYVRRHIRLARRSVLYW